MPSNKVCIERNGVSYCWNYDTSKIEVIDKHTIEAKDCPADVMYELMVLISKNKLTRE